MEPDPLLLVGTDRVVVCLSGMAHLIDRKKVCPVLLRCFWKPLKHNTLSDYRLHHRDILPAREVKLYTWRDATLREITDLLKDYIEELKYEKRLLDFSLVYQDQDGNLQFNPVMLIGVYGTLNSYPRSNIFILFTNNLVWKRVYGIRN